MWGSRFGFETNATSEYQACIDGKAKYRLRMTMVHSQPEMGDSTARFP